MSQDADAQRFGIVLEIEQTDPSPYVACFVDATGEIGTVVALYLVATHFSDALAPLV